MELISPIREVHGARLRRPLVIRCAAVVSSGMLVMLAGCSSTSTTPADAAQPGATSAPALPGQATLVSSPEDTGATVALPSTTTLAPPPCVPIDGDVVTASGRTVRLRMSALTAPSALVVILHGYTGTPNGIERYSEFTAPAAAAGIAVAYPQGTPSGENVGGFGWNSGAEIFATPSGDDVGALVEMIDAALSTGCVDPTRVTLVGESNGAGMALSALCDGRLAGRVARVVMVIPAVDPGVVGRCSAGVVGAARVPLTVVAGRIDRTVPFDGGRAPLLPQATWFEQAAPLVGGCSGVTAESPLTDRATVRRGSDCAVCTELIAIDDGTHTWPGSSDGVSDLVPGSFDLTARLIATTSAPPAACLA